MNNIELHEELWTNNGKIMLELSDYDLDLNKDYGECKLFGNFVVVDTVHEDSLKWEKEYVSGTLVLSETKKEYEKILKETRSNYHLLETLSFPLGATDRIAIVNAFDLVETMDGDYIEFSKGKYAKLLLSVFTNEAKTKVVFLGLLSQ